MSAVATVVPIEFRPTSSLPPTVERFAAFAAVAFIFAIAYPRHAWFAALFVIGAAVLLEVLQVLAPTRHGRPADVFVKILGAVSGLILGRILLSWQMRRERVARRCGS